MTTLLSRLTLVLLSCLTVPSLVGAQQPSGQDRVNPDAQLLQDFKARVDEYIELRDKLEKKVRR